VESCTLEHIWQDLDDEAISPQYTILVCYYFYIVNKNISSYRLTMISWTIERTLPCIHSRVRYGTVLTHNFFFQINDMRVTESGHLEYYLEYIDYPEEGKYYLYASSIFPCAIFLVHITICCLKTRL
jgi:hypothetical protein